MKTLKLTSCNNKFNKTPWLAKLSIKESDPKEFKHDFQKADQINYISRTRNEYEWDLEDDVLYAKGDIVNYSNYEITFFVHHDGKDVELTKRQARQYLNRELDISTI